MTAEAKKHIEEKFFDGYPQHESDYIGDRRLKDIADLMESYANQKALTIIEQAVNDLIEVYGDDNERYDAMYHGRWILETVRRKLKEAT